MVQKIFHATAVKVGLIVLVGLIFAGFTLPHMITLLIQARAGSWIDMVSQHEPENIEGHFSCLRMPDSQLIENDLDQIEKAVQWLGWASRITPNNAHTNYLLGQAYCLIGDYEQAVDGLEAYEQKRPANPLARMQKAFAYFSWAQVLTEDQDSTRETYLDRSILAFEQAGIGRLLLVQHGDDAFNQRNYRTAWIWYLLAQQHANLPEKAVFRLAMLDLALASDEKTANFLSPKYTLTVEEGLTIQPSNFFRLGDGSPVRVWDIDGSLVSVFFNNNDPGGVFIETYTSGPYCFAFDALDRAPSPTLIEVLLDFVPIGTIELTQGDENWQTFIIETQLDEGWHLLSLRLVNNARVNDKDRNGLVGEIFIQKCR